MESSLDTRPASASFLLPQAKAKARKDLAPASVPDPATPTGKGSRFARFFDPSASPAAAHQVPSPQQSIHMASPTRQDHTEPVIDKTQAFAALLGIKPASLAKTGQPHAKPASALAVPVPSLQALTQPPVSNKAESPPVGNINVETTSQSVDHMARLLGMLKSAVRGVCPITGSGLVCLHPVTCTRSKPRSHLCFLPLRPLLPARSDRRLRPPCHPILGLDSLLRC